MNLRVRGNPDETTVELYLEINDNGEIAVMAECDGEYVECLLTFTQNREGKVIFSRLGLDNIEEEYFGITEDGTLAEESF